MTGQPGLLELHTAVKDAKCNAKWYSIAKNIAQMAMNFKVIHCLLILLANFFMISR
jgi:hypothetical protein